VAGTHAVTHMFGALMPLVYPFIVIEFGIGYAAIGLLEGVSQFAGGLLQGPAGLLGRFIPRRVLLGMGNLLLSLSMGLMSLSPTFPFFFATNLMGRVAASPQHVVGTSLISEWFGKKLRGITFAINYSGANVGSIMVPLIAAGLFILIGWRGTVNVFILPGLVFGLLAIFMLPTAGKVIASTANRGKPKLSGEIIKVLKHRNTLFTIICSSLASGGRGLAVMSVFVPLYLRDTIRDGLGLDAVTVSFLFTILLIGSVVGPLFLGRISDQYGRVRTIQVILFLSSLCPFLLIVAGNKLSLIIPVLLAIGFTNYSFSALFQTMLADVAEPSVRDLAFSLFFPLGFVVGALWSFGLGLVADQFGFRILFIITALAPLSALPFTLSVKE